jgi:DNA topoisomerase-6 subunit B
VTPYADIRFVDPKGRFYMFSRATKKMPPPPTETLAHPYGVDVETIQRLIRITNCRNLLDFMRKHFHRVGQGTSLSFLDFAGFIKTATPQRLKPEYVTKLVETINKYKKYRKFFGKLSEEEIKASFHESKFPECGQNSYSSFAFIRWFC